MHFLEIRRQALHALYGVMIVLLHKAGILNLSLLFGILLGGGIMSFMVLKGRAPLTEKVLRLFEREHHLRNFPGRGILFFTIGAFLVLWIFQDDPRIAYAGILILGIGDAVTNLIGRHWGRLQTFLHPHKYLEGTLVGILVSVPIGYYFVPHLFGAIAAACVAMFLEMPHIRLFGYEIDDNLTIPLAASLTLSLFAA